jgi:hypothetical protein
MNEHLISYLTTELARKLRQSMLPTHLTEADIAHMFGSNAATFHANFSEINVLLTDATGFWGEPVLCPAVKHHPRTGYYTFYREGQKSLFLSVRSPEAGPYFIPDAIRS